MNKSSLLVAALVICGATTVMAQKKKVSSAENNLILSQFDKAKADIDEAMTHEKTMNDPQTYIVASRVYSRLASEGKLDEGVALGREFLEKAKTIAETPNAKGKIDNKALKNIKKEYVTFSNNSINAAIKAFDAKNYKSAEVDFVNANWANSFKEGYTEASDSVIINNAALSAMLAEDYEAAVKYYGICIDVDYDGPMSVLRVNYSYQQLKEKGVEGLASNIESNLKKGFEKYPESKDVLTTLIQYYLNEQRNEEALAYLNEAIAKDPENAQFYFARGCLNEKISRDDAIADYKTAIAKNDKLFNALYNLAVVYYNQAVEMVSEANNERDQKKYDALIADANKVFETALPYMEKAAENADSVENKKQCLDTVKSIYYRLGNYEKSQEVADLIKTL